MTPPARRANVNVNAHATVNDTCPRHDCVGAVLRWSREFFGLPVFLSLTVDVHGKGRGGDVTTLFVERQDGEGCSRFHVGSVPALSCRGRVSFTLALAFTFTVKAGRQEGRKAGRQEGRKAGRQEGIVHGDVV